MNEVKTKLTDLLQSDLSLEEKQKQLNLLQIQTPNTSITNILLLAGFQHVLKTNQAQYEDQLNHQKEQTELVKKQYNEIKEKLDIILQKQEEDMKAQQLKEEKRLKRLNRKKQPLTQPFLIHDYKNLIQTYSQINYVASRNRIALTILAITGIRFSELLNMKISQIKTLWTKGFIPINRVKLGPSSLCS